jgi:hypothetical protein
MTGCPKNMLFKSFTGLTVKEFDDIYDDEMAKKYGKHEAQRLSKRNERERSIGAGRHFKLNTKNRFLMLLAYCRLYITKFWLAFCLTRTKVTSAGISKRWSRW